MHVVLSGYYGFHNVGDDAILLSIISALKEEDPNIEITVLSNDPEDTKKVYGVNAVNRWKLKEVLNVIRSSDGLISGGGSLLQDKTGMKSVIYYSGVMMIAKLVGKPFFIYAQGIGPVDKTSNQRIVKSIISKAKKVTIRDEESKELLENIRVKNEITLVPDPVLGLEASAFESPWLNSIEITKPIVAVSVRDWPSEVNYKERIAQSLDETARKGYEIVFLPMHGEHDEVSSKEVLAMMKEKVIIAPHDASIEEKVAIIGKSHLLVGMRLHALIFAAVTRTPFVALSYDPKIDSFASQSNQPVAGHVCEEWPVEQLNSIITEQLHYRVREQEKLEQFMKSAQPAARNTARMAMDCFK
ncbi:polysaccharide pyruvyl transferase CsaB [Bacillus sp. FJAT-45350]|uniref:polysaccharide pyruvyl transferase CsaB n=1 Tax=Bacillus sp. FJAT-45350 TaxID=2011014 RepID=UPI000BB8AA1B|nr:polysaccharide pyruvyl transferase CsaB [Bacillus sp. FJAT-45350]